jgi:hypothetical protein
MQAHNLPDIYVLSQGFLCDKSHFFSYSAYKNQQSVGKEFVVF